ncbi:MAG: hypothetical protein JWM34_1127 [Ilumatobacteraceae bacterium]|nr:hypothetical protein [Ilumatobacteraceae bacterium]
MSRKRTPITLPSEDQVVALLRAANPVPESGLMPPSGRTLDARVAAIAAAVEADPRRPQRRRWWTGIGAGVAVLAAGTAVTWAVTRTDKAPNPVAVACYRTASLESDIVGLQANGVSPVEQCRAQWTDGELGHGEAPNLVACVSPAGASAVFPSDDPDVCGSLGLAALDPNVSTDQQALIALANGLSDGAAGKGCIDEATLRAIVTDAIAHAGASGITVKVDSSTYVAADRHCAVPGFDVATRTVTIDFIPDIFTDPSTPATGG